MTKKVAYTKAQKRGQQYCDLLNRGVKLDQIADVCKISKQSIAANVRSWCAASGETNPLPTRGSNVDAGIAELMSQFGE